MTTILQADQLDARRPGFGDADLVASARRGDEEAFSELVRRHSPKIYGLLVRVLGDPHEAEDVAQETFLKAWRGLPRFRGDAKFSTWLYRIAVNEANRRHARLAKAPLWLDGREDELTAGAIHDPHARAESAHDLSELQRLLDRLPQEQRVAVVLRDVEGLSNEEAAGLLGIGVRNFKSRLHRGRMSLREGLETIGAL